MSVTDISSVLEREQMIAVVREDSTEVAREVAGAIAAAGAGIIEITLTTPSALDLIRELRAAHPAITFAAGTIVRAEDVSAARDAGASLIVSPHFDPRIVTATKEQGLFSVAGAATVSEIIAAHQSGADVIKIYPARYLGGPGFIRAIRQPVRGIEMIPGGPVDLEEIVEYLSAGCAGVNLGASLAPPELVRHERWSAITELTHQAREIIRTWAEQR